MPSDVRVTIRLSRRDLDDLASIAAAMHAQGAVFTSRSAVLRHALRTASEATGAAYEAHRQHNQQGHHHAP